MSKNLGSFLELVLSLSTCSLEMSLSSSPSSPSVKIYKKVVGFQGRSNDIIYVPPLESQTITNNDLSSALIYFGGDVQDLSENMEEWKEWSLEKTSLLLHHKFPKRHIVIIRPSSLYQQTFSVFSNFIHSTDKYGNPIFKENMEALDHLKSLLESLLPKTQLQNITLLGFSKGCIVLNQMVYEMSFNYYNYSEFIKKIGKMVWLDGSHGGGKDTWITNETIITSFLKNVGNHIDIEIKLTPYQIDDEARPWIRNEEKKFSSILMKNHDKINRTVYFSEEPGSLKKHFDLLREI